MKNPQKLGFGLQSKWVVKIIKGLAWFGWLNISQYGITGYGVSRPGMLWSFKTRDTKLERFLNKNQLTQRKLLNFENWTNGEPQ